MSKQPNKHDDGTKKVVSLEEYLNLEDPTGYEVEGSTKTSVENSKVDDFQTLLNQTVKATKVDEKGNLIFPDGIMEEMKAAVRAEKKYRDLQRNFQSNQQELQAEKAKVQELENLIPNDGLTDEEREELEQLKLTDPDQWYQRKRELEDRASQTRVNKLNEAKETAASKAKQLTVEEQRQEAFELFNSQREVPITQEMLNNDIPMRLINKRDEMDVTDWLSEVANFLDSPKTVANNIPNNVQNLGKLGNHEGNVTPGEVDTDILYKEEVI